MKAIASREGLSKALAVANKIADSKAQLPILGNVLLRFADGVMQVVATDLVTTLATSVTCTEGEDGAVTVSARDLGALVASRDSDTARLSLENTELVVAMGRFRAALPTLPAADFPKTAEPPADLKPCGAEALRTMFARTAYCASEDESRYHLNGVFLDASDGQARAVATDGHRLSVANGLAFDGQAGVIIPSRGVRAIMAVIGKTDEDVQIAIGKHIFVRSGEALISSKLIDALFPPYANVIPKHGSRAIVDRKRLIESVASVAVLSSDVSRGVRLKFDADTISINARGDSGEATDEIETTYDGAGLEIGVNAGYLQDALNAFDGDEIALHVNGALDPLVLRPVTGGEDVTVIMPMRV